MASPVRVFISCRDIVQGSYFEVLFHQLPDGAVPKLAADRKFVVDGKSARVSLTTDSGLAHYPARVNDMFRQADVVVLLYNKTQRESFEGLGALYDFVSGPVRDFDPATFVLLGIVPAQHAPGELPHIISPQEVESCCSQFGASFTDLDAREKPKSLDDLWTFLIRSHWTRISSGAASSASIGAHTAPSSGSYVSLGSSNSSGAQGANSSSGSSSGSILSPRGTNSVANREEATLHAMLTNLMTRRETTEELTKAMAQLTAKKTEKMIKSAQKEVMSSSSSSKRDLLTVSPSRIDHFNVTLLTPTVLTFTISTSSKTPIQWTIIEPENVTNAHFFSIHESSGTVSKSKPVTVSIHCTFYQASEISRFIVVDSPQEGIVTPLLFLRVAAPLQPREPASHWAIDRKSISIGFRIASTPSANVYRATLYGAVVAVKEWNLDSQTGLAPPAFYTEWDAFVRLKHPNLAQFLGGGKERGEAFMVLEYLKYGQLGNFLHNPPPRNVVRTIDLRLRMATGLAKAMAYLHSQRMLHRDLTSANVLVDSDCSVKLGDFGEARAHANASAEYSHSLDWTAPELLGAENGAQNGAQIHTTKSDVFSFGVILWEFGAERAPARTLADVKNGILPSLPLDIKTRYPQFGDLVAQCTHIEPEMRPSFDDIVFKLESIRQSGPAALVPTAVAKSAISKEPPKYTPNADGSAPNPGSIVTTPSRILYRGQLQGNVNQGSPQNANQNNSTSSSHQSPPGSPSTQQNTSSPYHKPGQPGYQPLKVVDSVILPEMSLGPGQIAPDPNQKLSYTEVKPISPRLHQQVPIQIRNAYPISPASPRPLSLTQTAANGVMPSSAPYMPPSTNSNAEGMHTGSQYSNQSTSESNHLYSHVSPYSSIQENPATALMGASLISGPRDGEMKNFPENSASTTSPHLQTHHNRVGSNNSGDSNNSNSSGGGLILPAAVPLTAPPGNGSYPSSTTTPTFKLPSSTPKHSVGAQGASGAPRSDYSPLSANQAPSLLRFPSMSKFNGAQPSLTSPPPLVSPHGTQEQQNLNFTSTPSLSVVSPRSNQTTANAKDDNLLNWASEAYTTTENEEVLTQQNANFGVSSPSKGAGSPSSPRDAPSPLRRAPSQSLFSRPSIGPGAPNRNPSNTVSTGSNASQMSPNASPRSPNGQIQSNHHAGAPNRTVSVVQLPNPPPQASILPQSTSIPSITAPHTNQLQIQPTALSPRSMTLTSNSPFVPAPFFPRPVSPRNETPATTNPQIPAMQVTHQQSVLMTPSPAVIQSNNFAIDSPFDLDSPFDDI